MDLTAHTSLSPIWRGFAPSFVNYKKGCTRLAATSDKVYQLLAQDRCFSPSTPASSTTKTGRHDIAENGVQHQKSNCTKHRVLILNFIHNIFIIYKMNTVTTVFKYQQFISHNNNYFIHK